MPYSPKIREEELKNKVAADFFHKYDCTGIIKDIDFAVRAGVSYLLWAEAKVAPSDIIAMLAQLVLTIGKARTFNDVLPPKFFGCFDCEKIAFIPYADIQDIFHQNDFNWKVTPSNRDSKEFKLISGKIGGILNGSNTYIFSFDDKNSLKLFILKNFMPDMNITKIKIDKNNFISVYAKWLEAVKPTIAVDWDLVKKSGIIDGDFYLADLLSSENKTLKEKLFVLLKSDYYELDRKIEQGLMSSKKADFTDRQKAHNAFWAIYERPPREDYWDYIIERRDLLVPQDVRERKGSFFTPKIWVELSQKYIADALGENWQEEYYVWDCAAGTGNLLAGLTNPRNIWASTLDQADVDVMKTTGFLFENQVFQFDFLNDDFGKLPKGLRDIVSDEEKRKKLLIYINPPYAEDTTKTTITGTGKNKISVAQNKIHNKYADLLRKANHELFAQFLARIYFEMPSCRLANFSTLKNLQASNFLDFRKFFRASLEKIFVVPAETFDNVKGKFPIGFHIWDTSKKEKFEKISADVFDKDGNFTGAKNISVDDNIQSINKWIKKYEYKKEETIGYIPNPSPDFQHNDQVFLQSKKGNVHLNYTPVSKSNLIPACIYFVVRKTIPADWLNDRDQFLYPNDSWKADLEFQSDCLVYTLFHGQNNISCKHGINHWIPFTEKEINARESSQSSFMSDFLAGKVKFDGEKNLLDTADCTVGAGFKPAPTRLIFSHESMAVFAAGRELWRYYHAQPKSNANASLYDIREHFQGRNANGKMNNKSDDEKYNELIGDLREKLKILAKKIEPKVYEYGFLRR